MNKATRTTRPAPHPAAARNGLPAPTRTPTVMVDLSAAVAAASTIPRGGADVADRRRRLLAAVCKVFGDHLPGDGGPGQEFALPPRLRQTLKHLVGGDSEKQVAARLGLSRHTVHIYVKQLYRRLNVNSRGELLAKFVRGVRAGEP